MTVVNIRNEPYDIYIGRPLITALQNLIGRCYAARVPAMVKRCLPPEQGGCGRSKLVDEFWRDPKESDGRQKRCADCVKARRRERAEARAAGEDLPTVSEERRAQMRENAKRLHAEGRFGGADIGKLGGRPRKPRIADVVLEHFRAEGKLDLIIAAYESNLRSRNRGSRLKAAEALARMEEAEDNRLERARGGGKTPEQMSLAELEEFVSQGLAAMLESGDIDQNIITLPKSAIREVA